MTKEGHLRPISGLQKFEHKSTVLPLHPHERTIQAQEITAFLKKTDKQTNRDALLSAEDKEGFSRTTYNYKHCDRFFALLALGRRDIGGWVGPRWLNTAQIYA